MKSTGIRLLALVLLAIAPGGYAPAAESLEKLRDNYLAAKKKEADLKARTEPAHRKEREISKQMLAELEKSQAAWNSAEADVVALRNQIMTKYEEEARVIVVPAVLLDQYTEYKRRYNVLVEYRNYVDSTFFNKISKRIDELSEELKKAKAEGETKAAEIDKEIDALQSKKKEAERRLASALELPNNGSLLRDWLAGLAEGGKADRAALDAEEEMGRAFTLYVEALLKTSPPYVQSVAVAADGGKKVYEAAWAPDKSTAGNATSQNELDREADHLRESNELLKRDIGEMEKHLRDRAQDRIEIAVSLLYLGENMSMAGMELALAKETQITVLALIDTASTIVGVAVSGGTSLLASRGPELVEDAVSKKLSRAEMEVWRRTASGLSAAEQERVGSIFRGQRMGAGLNTEAEWAFAQSVLPQTRAKVDLDFVHAKAAEEAFMNRLKAKGAATVNTASADFSKWAAYQITASGESVPGWQVPVPVKVPDLDDFQSRDDWTSVVLNDDVELAFNKVISAGINQAGRTVLAVAKDSGRNPISTWQKIRGSLAFRNFTDVFKPDPALLVNVITTGTKAAFTKWIGEKQQKAIDSWLENEAKYIAGYQTYYLSLQLDKKIWDVQQSYRRELAANLGRLAQLRQPRKLNVAVNEMIPSPNAELSIEIRYSTFLTTAPVVKVSGVPAKVKPLGPAEASDRWLATIAMKEITSEATIAPLGFTLDAKNKPFSQLDAEPGSAAYLSGLGEKPWSDYEAGIDGNHQLKCFSLEGTWTATGYERGPEEVKIKQIGRDVTAIKVNGSTYVARDDVTWKATLGTNGFTAKVQTAKGGGRDAKWLEGKITIVDKDHIAIEDANGWKAAFVRKP